MNKKGHPVYITDKKESDLIGREVKVEHGTGKIVSIETFPLSKTDNRYGIKIEDNSGKPFLKSLFPDNVLYYWIREVEFLDTPIKKNII